MTKEETIAWVADEKNANEYIEGFDSLRIGTKCYDDLLALVEDGTVTAEQLPEYGFPMPGDAAADLAAAGGPSLEECRGGESLTPDELRARLKERRNQ